MSVVLTVSATGALMISNAKTCDWIFPVTRVSSIKIPVDDTKKLTTAEYRMEIYEDMRKRRQDILRELRARKTGKGKGKAKGKAKVPWADVWVKMGVAPCVAAVER